ncbi:hypothetical protein L7F22_012463 [Adiantum nelumboides]|nr:hypothetical protein [Adiantum nelumboides]
MATSSIDGFLTQPEFRLAKEIQLKEFLRADNMYSDMERICMLYTGVKQMVQDHDRARCNLPKHPAVIQYLIKKSIPQLLRVGDSMMRSEALARLDALESDNIAMELVDVDDDDEVSLEDEEHESLVYQRRHKRETRQARALEKLATAKKARSFLDLLHEANLEALPSHVPTYLRAAVGPPSSSARRHFCSVCGYFANYTCTVCGARFCCIRCQKIHTDTRCQKFVA